MSLSKAPASLRLVCQRPVADAGAFGIGEMLIRWWTVIIAFAIFGLLISRVNCAEALPIVPGKSLGPLRLGMNRTEAEHLIIISAVNASYNTPPYSEDSWTSNVAWSADRMSFGTLRMICKNNRIVQIEISTHVIQLPKSAAEVAAAYPAESERNQEAIKARLAKLIVMTAAGMTTPFKVLRQRHPGMRVDQFSDSDNPQFWHSYYYVDDVQHGIAFTYLAENTRDQHQIKVRDLTPDDGPERIIIHPAGTRVLAVYEGQENRPSHPSPFLPRLRAWFKNSSNRGQQP